MERLALADYKELMMNIYALDRKIELASEMDNRAIRIGNKLHSYAAREARFGRGNVNDYMTFTS